MQKTLNPSLYGVNLGGFLHIEEWMFSNYRKGADRVAADPNNPQGTVFPPMFDKLPFFWASEGELISKLVDLYGTADTVLAVRSHRDTYVTERDIQKISSLGIKNVRLPLPWYIFMDENPLEETIIVDPVYPDRKFVSIPITILNKFIKLCSEYDVKVLLDLHSFPGGSSQGSYNGIFPHDPVFWTQDTLMSLGLSSVSNMYKWYVSLDPCLQKFILGFTPMNEPSHLLPQYQSKMESWLKQSIDLYDTITYLCTIQNCT